MRLTLPLRLGLSGALIITIVTSPVLAQEAVSRAARSGTQPLKAAINTAAERLALQASGGTGENPYFVPGIALMAAGGGLFALGLANPGFECKETSTSFGCGTTYNKGLVFGGLGAAGVGAYLFLKGQQMKNRQHIPTLDVRRGKWSVRVPFVF